MGPSGRNPGILNCVRVMMKKEVMVPPPTERRQAAES
jgi:hypothetical protein